MHTFRWSAFDLLCLIFACTVLFVIFIAFECLLVLCSQECCVLFVTKCSIITSMLLLCRKRAFVRDALAARSLLMQVVPSRSVACFQCMYSHEFQHLSISTEKEEFLSF